MAVWEGKHLVGLLPVCLHSWNGRRPVTLLGNGPSKYMDVLAEPEARNGVTDAVLNELFRRQSEWDVASLETSLRACVSRLLRRIAARCAVS